MKIDTAKIEGYDSLTAEEKLKALEEYEFEVPAQKSDDNASLKKMLSDRNSEIKKLKDEIRSKMDENERKELERNEELEQLRQSVASYEKATKTASLKATYLAIGYNEDLATRRATFMADGDIENATAVEKEFLVWHDKELNAQAVRSTPTPVSSVKNTKKYTADDFRKMGLSEMKALKAEDPELYEALRNA